MLGVIEEHDVKFPASDKWFGDYWGIYFSDRFYTVEHIKANCHYWASKKEGLVEPNRK